jgi:hypothetical protein
LEVLVKLIMNCGPPNISNPLWRHM